MLVADALMSQTLQDHANKHDVGLWVAPKLSSDQLSLLIKQSLAVVSMAHKEPFGLTPIEAFSIGTAIFVNDGGFIDSIVDGESGRLISGPQPWNGIVLWTRPSPRRFVTNGLIMEDSGSLNYDYRHL